MMSVTSTKHSGSRVSIPARMYEKLRIELSDNLKEIRKTTDHPSHLRKGETHWNFGRKTPEDVKQRQVAARSGENHWSFNTPRSKEDREKISNTLSGRTLDPEHKRKSLIGLDKARIAASQIDRTFWRVHANKNIWSLADEIFKVWDTSKKQGSRALSSIIQLVGEQNGFDFGSPRQESLLRYFRTYGNPLDDDEWVKDFKS